jgi:hypothetical protein
MSMSHKLAIVILHCFMFIVSIFIVVLLYINPPCIVDSLYAIALPYRTSRTSAMYFVVVVPDYDAFPRRRLLQHNCASVIRTSD